MDLIANDLQKIKEDRNSWWVEFRINVRTCTHAHKIYLLRIIRYHSELPRPVTCFEISEKSPETSRKDFETSHLVPGSSYEIILRAKSPDIDSRAHHHHHYGNIYTTRSIPTRPFLNIETTFSQAMFLFLELYSSIGTAPVWGCYVRLENFYT